MTNERKLDIAAIRERLGKRTQGDWSLKHREDGFTLVVGSSVKENYEALGWSGNIADIRSPHGAGYSMQDLEANAEFIVNAPTDITTLLAEVKRLRGFLCDKCGGSGYSGVIVGQACTKCHGSGRPSTGRSE